MEDNVDIIYRSAVMDAIHEWIVNREYEFSNATYYLKKRIEEIPLIQKNDLINKSEALEALNTWDKFACMPNGQLLSVRYLDKPEEFVTYIKYEDVVNCIMNMPSTRLEGAKPHSNRNSITVDIKVNDGELDKALEKIKQLKVAVKEVMGDG